MGIDKDLEYALQWESSSKHFYIKRSFYYEMMVIVHRFFLHDYLLTVLISTKTKMYKVPGELI